MNFSFPRRWAAPAIFLLVGLAVSWPLLIADPRSRVLAANTLALSAAVSAASVFVGAPLAFVLARTDAFGRRGAVLVLVTLLCLPLYLQAAAWQAAFGFQGWFTALAGSGVFLDGWRGAIFVHTVAAIPWVVLIVGVGLRLAEPELEEEALLDARPLGVFRRVTLRRAAGAVGVAALWVAVATSGEMTVTDLFQVRTYAEQIYTEFAVGDVIDPAPWRFWPSVVATAWIIAAGLWLVSRLVPPEGQLSVRACHVFRLGRWRVAASLTSMAVVGALAGVPLASLLTKAGMVVTRDGLRLARHWSFEQCIALVAASPARFGREFGWTVACAVPAATGAVLVGVPLAWLALGGRGRAAMVGVVIALALALPGPLVGLGLISIFNDPRWPWLVDLYDYSLVPIWLAQLIRGLPLATLVAWYALRTIPREHLDSASLDGGGAWTRFVRVGLAQRRAALAVSWLVALVVAWGELSASLLLAPPGVMTLSRQIFGLIHYGVDDQVAAIALTEMGLFFLVALVLAALVRRASSEAD